MLTRFTHAVVRTLDWLAARSLFGYSRTQDPRPEHQRVGRRGEEHAYFYLRKLGYVMVARNFRSPRRRGEIDLIGWDKDVLCFIEVKTRTSHQVKPAEAAVDREKFHDLTSVAREYLRELRRVPQWRFDVLSVYYEDQALQPRFELFKNSGAIS